ncbi:MAG: peptide chain release factor N(5)-glutamine methyltransferase [Mollicutes bacterium]|nr:peptide chain release factor N(5)-glutamine methyltransferase [Mollicutes bacterium]
MNNYDIDLIKKYIEKSKQEEAIKKYKEGYPVQYLIGNVDFFGNKIIVNEKVLIPRFETEYLVDDTLKLLKKYNFINPKTLDIGTGSGCISIALKKNIKCEVTAVDISRDALEVAKKNAEINNVEINFVKQAIEDFSSFGNFDVIISNPPYISMKEKIDPKTKHEPHNALYSNEDGTYFYRVILEKAIDILAKKSIIAFEIGDKQGSKVIKMAKELFPKANIEIKKDLNDFERYIYIINK